MGKGGPHRVARTAALSMIIIPKIFIFIHWCVLNIIYYFSKVLPVIPAQGNEQADMPGIKVFCVDC